MKSLTRKIGRLVTGLIRFVTWILILSLVTMWTLYLVGAFYFDMRVGLPAGLTSIIFLIGLVTLVARLRGRKRWLAFLGVCTLITAIWSTIRPSNDRDWVADKAVLARAEFDGDLVTIRNMRDAAYPERFVSHPAYADRKIELSKVRGMDLINCYWTNDYIAHPMLSWRFENGKSFTISVENRLRKGQEYSVLSGFYKQFELIYVVCTDRDAVLRRTVRHPRDNVYIYKLDVTPAEAQALLIEMLGKVNKLYHDPAWYNTLWNNCTTTIHIHLAATQEFPMPWSWGVLFPGLYCKSIYDHGGMESALPYEELWKRGHLNGPANRIGRTDDFWIRIRKDVPGFEGYFSDIPQDIDARPSASSFKAS